MSGFLYVYVVFLLTSPSLPPCRKDCQRDLWYKPFFHCAYLEHSGEDCHSKPLQTLRPRYVPPMLASDALPSSNVAATQSSRFFLVFIPDSFMQQRLLIFFSVVCWCNYQQTLLLQDSQAVANNQSTRCHMEFSI